MPKLELINHGAKVISKDAELKSILIEVTVHITVHTFTNLI